MDEKLIQALEDLLAFGIKKGLIVERDRQYCRNALYDLLKITPPASLPEAGKRADNETCTEIMADILDVCATDGFRDHWDARIMGILSPRPSEVAERFTKLYAEAPSAATQYFYHLSRANNYIQVDRVAKNMRWLAQTEFGELEITVNLSKPEKDPREIAAAKSQPQTNYPSCLLCVENEGFAGTATHPARQNLRLIPVTLDDKQWYLQYSPYVYYNEHCIVLNAKHTPMKINRSTFVKLLAFTQRFPHYFIGSNADIPIVGGSILTHDHFQGGNHVFPMERAEAYTHLTHTGYGGVDIALVKWPMSVIRLSCDAIAGPEKLIDLAAHFLEQWRGYSDEAVGVYASTRKDGQSTQHNAITPIARCVIDKNGQTRFELDLVLRNNLTTEEHPMGVFHPHAELHHIKKENIGLIEVMGLAVLPGRLASELDLIADHLSGNEIDMHAVEIHKDWITKLEQTYGRKNEKPHALNLLQAEVGKIFMQVLSHAGVFKFDECGKAALGRFMEHCGCRIR